MKAAHRLPPVEWRKEPGLLLTSAAQRKAVFARDKGVCTYCRKPAEVWDAEHTIALHAIRPSIGFPEALKFWRLENLATACRTLCHRAKSARERTAHAKVKRIIAKRSTKRPKRDPPRRPLPCPKPFQPRQPKQLSET